MNYRELMSVLSQCELGAVLLSEDGAILELNETGLRLLHGGGSLTGKYLRDIAPNPVSYTHLDVYKRQVQSQHVGEEHGAGHAALVGVDDHHMLTVNLKILLGLQKILDKLVDRLDGLEAL